MGVSHVWVCDERKEFIDPYPLDCPHLYCWCDVQLTESVAGGYTDGWYGLLVRLLSDCGGGNDEYYLRTAGKGSRSADDTARIAEAFGGSIGDVYRDVTAEAHALAARWFPDAWWKR
jgi:hypothetical protein